jgi:mono/diheme cytochrome c family protein
MEGRSTLHLDRRAWMAGQHEHRDVIRWNISPPAFPGLDFPRLAGQHAQYVLKQLASFQSNMRNVAVMHGVAQNLRVAEMESVAAFLEVQP